MLWKEECKLTVDQDWFKWFTGFVDGEGCFYIAQRNRVVSCTRLAIGLRNDDLPILLEIQTQLQMGTIHCRGSRSPNDFFHAPNANPLAEWSVSKISDCQKLIALFDQFPLKTKKKRDYAVWREATLELQKPHRQRNQAKLNYLYNKLKLVRQYNHPTIEEFEPVGLQLEFWMEEEQGE